MKKQTKKVSKEIPVLVTTAHRGVFFGYTSDWSGNTITLKRARMCAFWSRAMKGVFGLASIGPDADCRIGHPCDLEVRNVTAVAQCSADAAARWEAAPWKL
jgi:hypothetical protein